MEWKELERNTGNKRNLLLPIGSGTIRNHEKNGTAEVTKYFLERERNNFTIQSPAIAGLCVSCPTNQPDIGLAGARRGGYGFADIRVQFTDLLKTVWDLFF